MFNPLAQKSSWQLSGFVFNVEDWITTNIQCINYRLKLQFLCAHSLNKACLCLTGSNSKVNINIQCPDSSIYHSSPKNGSSTKIKLLNNWLLDPIPWTQLFQFYLLLLDFFLCRGKERGGGVSCHWLLLAFIQAVGLQ